MANWTGWLQPAGGGLLVGVLGVGYSNVNRALNGQMALRFMALLVIFETRRDRQFDQTDFLCQCQWESLHRSRAPAHDGTGIWVHLCHFITPFRIIHCFLGEQ